MERQISDLNHKRQLDPLTPGGEEYVEVLKLLKSSLLPEQDVDCVGNTLQEGSFKEFIAAAEINISQANFILSSLTLSSTVPKEVALYTVLLSGEHSECKNWTSSKIQCSLEKLQQIILERVHCLNFSDVLLLYKVNYFLTELKPKLFFSTWKKYPAAVVCFGWILQHLKYPHLADNLGFILPTCLLLVDDHEDINKIFGLKCLLHLTQNVSQTDLIQYGRGDVIYNAVEHMTYSRDPQIIPHVSNFLVAFLSKTEHSFNGNSITWTRFDDVLNLWLPSMEMEQGVVLRETYIDCLNDLLQAMGIASVRWSVKLLRILSEYTEQHHTLHKSLLCLLTFIRVTWPRISANARSICLILMKVKIRMSNKSADKIKPSEKTEEILQECFHSLLNISDKECCRLISELTENDETSQFCSFIPEKHNKI